MIRMGVVLLVLLLVFCLSACGGGSKPEAAVSSADEKALADKLAQDAQKVPEPASSATVSSAGLDKLLGEWVDTANPDRFAKITKDGEDYKYQDNDGTYPGSLKDGVLIIRISDSADDTAKVFIDTSTGCLVTNYQGDIYEFSRKLD